MSNNKGRVKSSADYQREFRQRMRDQGLVKKELWIRPENAPQLPLIEARLRRVREDLASDLTEQQPEAWTTEKLYMALSANEHFNPARAKLELLDEEEPVLVIVMKDYGHLPMYISVMSEQIVVESILWSVKQVKNREEFNERVLRTHKYFPLSTMSLENLGEGEDFYCMFGALSSRSILESIIFEIETLAENIMDAVDTYSEFLLYSEHA